MKRVSLFALSTVAAVSFCLLPALARAFPKASPELLSCTISGKPAVVSQYYKNQLIWNGMPINAISVAKTSSILNKDVHYLLDTAEGIHLEILEEHNADGDVTHALLSSESEGGKCASGSEYVDTLALEALVELNLSPQMRFLFASCALSNSKEPLSLVLSHGVEKGSALVESVPNANESRAARYVFLARGFYNTLGQRVSRIEFNGVGSFAIAEPNSFQPPALYTLVTSDPKSGNSSDATLVFGDDRLDSNVQSCSLVPEAFALLKQWTSEGDSKD